MNEPVGFLVSSLMRRPPNPSSTPSLGAARRGVPPSPKVTTSCSSTRGRSSLYLQTPGGSDSSSLLLTLRSTSGMGMSAPPHFLHLASRYASSVFVEHAAHSNLSISLDMYVTTYIFYREPLLRLIDFSM